MKKKAYNVQLCLETSSEGDSALFQWLSAHTVNEFFLISGWNLYAIQFVPFSPCLLLAAPCEVFLHSRCSNPLKTGIMWWVPPEPSLLWGLKTKLLQPFLTGHVLWSSFWLSFGPFPFCPQQSWIVGTVAGHSTPGATWQALSRVGWLHFYLS